jgi:phage terminase large subunit-like protein
VEKDLDLSLAEDSSAVVAQNVDLAELVKLCAVDSELFGKVFFPGTFRQKSPSFAKQQWEPLENPRRRLVNMIVFRGGRKTTILRTFAAKRISYGISRTILWVGVSEQDAFRSVAWIKNRLERNHLWRNTFKLERGRKWEESQIEIIHKTFQHTVNVLGVGITGSLRGINFDDYRPDLIIVDDPQTDETAATSTQREKTADLILGAVKNSLAPITEEPNAKIAMAITPQHQDDISQQALKDPQWETVVFPCWSQKTLDLEVDKQESSWPERFTSVELRDDKKAAIRRNKLSIFAREMECRLVSKETASFRPTWLHVRNYEKPRGCFAVLGIDPVPPPSEAQISRALQTKDWEAQYVWGRSGGKYELLDFRRNRGHEPNWSVTTALSLAREWRVARIVVESVAYQRVLKWMLEQEMRRRGTYYQILPFVSKQKKYARIMSTIGTLGPEGLLVVGAENDIFINQYEAYGPTYQGEDDDLDASSIALSDLANPYLERLSADGELDSSDVEELPRMFAGRAP